MNVRTASIVVLQSAALYAINAVCTIVVARAHLAFPGNVAGIVVLYTLFATKLVPVGWFDRSASFLVRHLAFFFIPITVGLMDAGGLLAHDGIGIATTLVLSGAMGILFAGLVSQRLARAAELRVAT